MQHKDFTLKNPNRLRSVVSSFASCQNKFHAEDGSGYEFMGDMVLEVDQLNPQVGVKRCSALPSLVVSPRCCPSHSDLMDQDQIFFIVQYVVVAIPFNVCHFVLARSEPGLPIYVGNARHLLDRCPSRMTSFFFFCRWPPVWQPPSARTDATTRSDRP